MSTETVAKPAENGKVEEPTYATLQEALLAFQMEAPKLQKTAINPHFKSKYVSLDTLMGAVTPALAKVGLVWMTFPGRDDKGDPALLYQLIHVSSGKTVQGEMPLMLSKMDAQGQGSAITYARRYSLMAVLGLVADEDDDGNKASGGTTQLTRPTAVAPSLLTDEQRERVLKAVEEGGGNLDLILAAVGVDSAENLTADHAHQIKKLLAA